MRPRFVQRAAAVALALLALAAPAFAKVRIAASTTDLASIASSIGGPEVDVFAIAKPSTDVHRVEVLPSYMVRVGRADLYLKVGLGLDQWADGIIDGSRNSKIQVVDCSVGVDALEKPAKVDASMGDVHPFGNPHYWLDPRNGAIAAHNIAEALAKADPAHAADYRVRSEAFGKQCDAAFAQGEKTAATIPVKTIITYHTSWSYLAKGFGLEVAGTVEPVPGIPPTLKHLEQITALVKERKVQVLLQEPYFSADAGKLLTRETGVRVVQASGSCDDAAPGAYLAHIQQVLALLAAAPAAK